MNILRYIAFSKIILDFFFTFFFAVLTLKNKPSRSRRSESGVKEKCIRGEGEVHQGSRTSALGVKEKCVRVKEKCFSWIPYIQQKHFSLTPDTLLLDPWRTSIWPVTHFSLTPDSLLLELEGLFFRVKKQKKNVNWKFKIIFENAILYILKYSCALVVIS